ncbi:MAG TPA: ABC transporter substrate-binding protein [Chloroflexota bacterium]|nr:ABC transporter substrate-binding protein [Chloroflexota bacterium]
MRQWRFLALSWMTIALLAAGCAGTPGAPPRTSDAASSRASSGPKHIVAAMMGNPPTPIEKAVGGGSGGRIPGITGLQQLVDAGLTILDDKGHHLPLVAEAVPSLENGLWIVSPDGRMQTTWKIRQGATWHDGAPFTSEDLVFTSVVEQDNDLPFERNPAYRMIESIEGPDPQTIVVKWKQPFIDADQFYISPQLPKHILEKPFIENKESFQALPYWNVEFIGNGPYKVREWARDTYTVLQANDAWIEGRPKIDEIEVRFLADENAFMANILANQIDVTIGKSITLEQTLSVRDQWANGHIEMIPETTMKIWPQFIGANPQIITNVQFRKALMAATNRQEMVDTIMGGLSSVAHSNLLPTDAEISEVDSAIVKYQFDPRQATRLIEGLGYTKGNDGLFHDQAGQPLSVQITSTDENQNTKPMFAVAEYWQQAGVGTETVIIPIQRQRDREYRATFPGFALQGGASGLAALQNSHGSQARLPENNYTGSNYSRYINPEFDALLDTYASTIPRVERLEALKAVLHMMTDQLSMMTLYYATSSTMISNRMVNAGRDPTWNAPQWDLK